MSNKIKLSLFLTIIFIIFCNLSITFASDIQMDLTTGTEDEPVADLTDNSTTNEDTLLLTPETSSEASQATSVGLVADEGLSLANILNIFLITIGVILILLAIAIIIRLK